MSKENWDERLKRVAKAKASAGEAGLREGICCFCLEPVETGGQDPSELSMVTVEGQDQSWPCHARCFRDRLSYLPYADAIITDED
jgi:hypothetical protein